MKTIPLTKGYFTKVDDDDYINLASVRWYASISDSGIPRASRNDHRKDCIKHILMSRVIMSAEPGMYVDHINGDTLDNRKCNLRICTESENNRNRKTNKNKIGYKGVWKESKTQKWRSGIRVNGISIKLGTFLSEKDAAIAYNEAAKNITVNLQN